MSDIALVMVEAIQARMGDIDIWPDDYHLFTEDVQSDEVLIVRKPTDEERNILAPVYHSWDTVTEVMKPFWAFRLTSIGDWIGTFTNPVSDLVDSNGWDQFQNDVPELVKIAERIQREDMLCPLVNFVVAYQLITERATNGEIVNLWCELLGQVDLYKVPQIIKREK